MEKLTKTLRYKMNKLLITAFILFVSISGLKAQDTLRLGFREAVDLGLKNNVDLNRLNNQQEVLKIEKTSAFLGHFPRLTGGTNLMRQIGQQSQLVGDDWVIANQTNDMITANLTTSLPIFNGGRRINNTQATKLFAEAGENTIQRAAQDVIFNVASQYLQVLLDEELYKIALENLENQKKQLEQIDGYVDAGLRTQADLYNQQSEVARLETVALNAKIQWETDAWVLAETIQLDPEIFPTVEPVRLNQQFTEYANMDLEELYQIGIQNRKDLKSQQLLESATKNQLSAIKGIRYPQLNAFFDYNTFFTSLDNRAISDQLWQVYPQRTFGLSLNLPIFTNFENKATIARSRLQYNNQQLDRMAVERRVYQEIKLAYENYKASIKREEATKIQLEAAVEAQKAISERFRLGVSNFVDLATANQQLVTGQSDYAQALYTLFFQEVILRYQLGVLAVD
jgi:outer membrane protein